MSAWSDGGEAVIIVGKGIDAWRGAIGQVHLELAKAADTDRNPCWQRRIDVGAPNLGHLAECSAGR